MDELKNKEETASQKKHDNVDANPKKNENQTAFLAKDEVAENIFNQGFTKAGEMSGDPDNLRLSLHTFYQDYKRQIRINENIQEKYKDKYQTKIDLIEHERKLNIDKVAIIKEESIPNLKMEIENFTRNIDVIKKNPKEVGGDNEDKVRYFIGGIILLFLTVFLFIFYSSASYSAFFKEFSLNNIGVASSIFDPRAISNALSESSTELLLILTIPFVFLGLGFLIHAFMLKKGIKKYIFTASILIVSFIYDVIIAYEITEKIYNIRKSMSFVADKIPDYKFAIAITNVSFWLIIFSGFVVYLIWGFVFSFFMEAYGKLDKVNVAIKENQNKISEIESQIKEYKLEMDKINEENKKKDQEITELISLKNGSTIPLEDTSYYLNHFFTGWIAWMTGNKLSAEKVKESHSIFGEFLNKRNEKFSSNNKII